MRMRLQGGGVGCILVMEGLTDSHGLFSIPRNKHRKRSCCACKQKLRQGYAAWHIPALRLLLSAVASLQARQASGAAQAETCWLQSAHGEWEMFKLGHNKSRHSACIPSYGRPMYATSCGLPNLVASAVVC